MMIIELIEALRHYPPHLNAEVLHAQFGFCKEMEFLKGLSFNDRQPVLMIVGMKDENQRTRK